MTGIALLDVAIGVLFVILTFSLIASTMQEAVASILNWRGRMLRRGLFRLLESTENGKKLIDTAFYVGENALSGATLTFDVLKHPSLQTLQGSKSLIGRQLGHLPLLRPLPDTLRDERDAAETEARRKFREMMDGAVEAFQTNGDQSALDQSRNQAENAYAKKLVQIAQTYPVNNRPMSEMGRMPSSIPQESFATALIETLFDRMRVGFGEAITVARAKAEAKRASVAVAYHNQQTGAVGAPPNAGLLQRHSDQAFAQVHEALGPDIAYGRAFAEEMAAYADRALVRINQTIGALPMDERLRDRLRGALKDIAISRALSEDLGHLTGFLDGGEEAIRKTIAELDSKVAQVKAEIGQWFDRSMDRVTGWYVRRAKYGLFALGTLMACVVNFDLIGYSGQLLRDEQLRQRIVEQAEAAAAAGNVAGLEVQRQTDLIHAALLVNTDPGEEARAAITAEELAANEAKLTPAMRQALGLSTPAPTDTAAADAERQAAAARLNATLTAMPGAIVIDRDNNGIDDGDRLATAEAYVANIKAQYGKSVDVLKTQFADQGVRMGRTCPVPSDAPPVSASADTAPAVTADHTLAGNMAGGWQGSWLHRLWDPSWLRNVAWENSWLQCVKQSWDWQAAISWLVIGLGCTLGGQFWFDLMRSVLKVRAAASGVDSDLKSLMGGSSSGGGQADGRAGQNTS